MDNTAKEEEVSNTLLSPLPLPSDKRASERASGRAGGRTDGQTDRQAKRDIHLWLSYLAGDFKLRHLAELEKPP